MMSFLEEIIFFFHCFFGRITCWSKIGCNNEKNMCTSGHIVHTMEGIKFSRKYGQALLKPI